LDGFRPQTSGTRKSSKSDDFFCFGVPLFDQTVALDSQIYHILFITSTQIAVVVVITLCRFGRSPTPLEVRLEEKINGESPPHTALNKKRVTHQETRHSPTSRDKSLACIKNIPKISAVASSAVIPFIST